MKTEYERLLNALKSGEEKDKADAISVLTTWKQRNEQRGENAWLTIESQAPFGEPPMENFLKYVRDRTVALDWKDVWLLTLTDQELKRHKRVEARKLANGRISGQEVTS